MENFSAEILNNLISVKNMLRECLHMNLITMKFKEILVEKRWVGQKFWLFL